MVRLSVINVRHFRFSAPVCQLALIKLTAFHTNSSPFSMSLHRIKAFVYMVVIKSATGNQIQTAQTVMKKIKNDPHFNKINDFSQLAYFG